MLLALCRALLTEHTHKRLPPLLARFFFNLWPSLFLCSAQGPTKHKKGRTIRRSEKVEREEGEGESLLE